VKGKYFQSLLIVGVLPVLLLAGVYFGVKLTEAPPAPLSSAQGPGEVNNTSVNILQSQVGTLASTLYNNILKTHDDIPNLTAQHGDSDLTNFKSSHPGVQGLMVVSPEGKILKNVPAAPVLADPQQYASSDEFKTIQERLQANPGKTYQFYTQRLGYPAFFFAQPSSDKSIVIAVFNLGYIFTPPDPRDTKSGVYFILDANSGRYFYHSNPAKLTETFNPNNDAWLTKVTSDLANQQASSSLNPGVSVMVYAPLGFAKLGVVNQVPYSTIVPSTPAPKITSKPTLNAEFFLKCFYNPFGLGVLILIAWVLLLGSLYLNSILAPLRRASAVVLNAAQNQAPITPEILKAFGTDEVGQMVQAAAMLIQNLEKEKEQNQQEKEETLRQYRTQMDEKSKDAAAQVSTAQQLAQTAKNELGEKSQVLNDKLKELDALKAMSEGLRNQTEQAKTENSQLKGQISVAEKAQADALAKVQETETKLKEMEAKLLSAVSAASAIQVSSVRAAAIRTMADELKTTLGIIKGYVSSALGTVQGGISEKQQEFLGMVINRSARLEKFINDLLDIYQVEIESEDAKREEVNLGSEIEGLAFNFQAQAEVKSIKLRVEPKPNLPKIPIIRRRFNQLWNILYLQIIKDAPRGASIPITVEAIGENVKVTVEDPGLNVKTESLAHMFDEFYDPKHTASPQLAGTGLKFALVKTILAGHGGGAVAEKSDPGTRLILTFPVKYRKPSEVAAAAAAAAALTAESSAPLPVKVPAPGPLPIGAVKPAVQSPKPGATSSGVLDALIAGKVPSVMAAPQKGTPGTVSIPSGAPPAAPIGAPPVPSKPAIPPLGAPPLGMKSPSPKGPIPVPGLLDALLDKKALAEPPKAPGAPVAPAPPIPPKPLTPIKPDTLESLLGNKPAPPPSLTPSIPGVAPAPRPPSIPPAASMPVRPPAPTIGGPVVLPKAPLTPLAPTIGIPKPITAPVPPPPSPLPSSGAPKVVPTSLKPTTPPGGVFDLDNLDTVKTDMGAPKPSAPPIPLKPSTLAPGVPPGGLNASNPVGKEPIKENDGELIE
jgi:signal transduction histidine kinase